MTTWSPSERARYDRKLLRRYHEHGDASAREALVRRHLPLVRSLARRYAGRGEALEDIEQVGTIGLIKAIDRYELSREVALTTYATPNVVGEIKRHFRDKAWTIRVPRHLQELNGKLSKAIERLTATLGRSPTIAEIAAHVDATPEDVLEAFEAGAAYSPASLSVGTSWDGDLDPMEMIGAEDAGFELADHRTRLEPALSGLSAREREILRLRFDEGLTQTQIAELVGISQMHVSRLIRRSLERMRAELS
ncbi:MAG: SigB/SigF/SigG family RNA polymerase sigma factor [Thermoleophilaceae bacterium]|nr:SigB/SigF/SigG family RNA polymerase sigma factor [Thermoleophilaceae bacterium]